MLAIWFFGGLFFVILNAMYFDLFMNDAPKWSTPQWIVYGVLWPLSVAMILIIGLIGFTGLMRPRGPVQLSRRQQRKVLMEVEQNRLLAERNELTATYNQLVYSQAMPAIEMPDHGE